MLCCSEVGSLVLNYYAPPTFPILELRSLVRLNSGVKSILILVILYPELEFRAGDILMLRTGYVEAYKALDVDQRREVASVKEWSRSRTE